jgi:tRNA G10  N-methylase Trm11
MEDYFFFLGRNYELSLQEIISFLEARGILGKFIQESNIAMFSLEESMDPAKVIEKLGGTIKIGKAITKFSGKKALLDELKKLNFYDGVENKLKFGLTVYPEDDILFRDAREILESYFKNERIRALFKKPENTPASSMKVDLEFFIVKLGKNYHFGKIEGVYDSKDAEFRDMHRPFRRSELAISPRLAKILINFSEATENSVLLDPFCGVGTILQEAMLQNINVIGADIDSGIIENCKRNMLWLGLNYPANKASYRIFTSNAIDLPGIIKEKVDAIASEPFLIPLITYTPKDTEARKMIAKAKETYIKTLNELRTILKDGGRIALSLPVMKARESMVHVNIDEVCMETGLKLIAGPLSEAREGQRVERELIILEKVK